jgi:uncharacterized SAM-binding protein YcdF (DUF218 family)
MAEAAATPAPRPFRKRRIGLLVLALLLIYVAQLTVRIELQSRADETRGADAIVVFGAAEYAGKPSPVYRARLEHAAALFERGVAPVVITTGGAGGDPVYNEGQVGRDFLLARGIHESRLIAETQGRDTEESARRVATIMKANGMHTCVAVSDGYHIFRIKRMLEAEGVTVYGAPRPESRSAGWLGNAAAIGHEVISYTMWKLGLG